MASATSIAFIRRRNATASISTLPSSGRISRYPTRAHTMPPTWLSCSPTDGAGAKPGMAGRRCRRAWPTEPARQVGNSARLPATPLHSMALFADAALSSAMAREVEMEVVAMVEVVVRPEHGGEYATGAAIDIAQEIALGQGSPPAALDVDDASVREHEPRDVDGVGMAVLGQVGTVDVVHGSARVRGRQSKFDHLRPQAIARRWEYHALHPTIDCRHHRTSDEGGRPQLHQTLRSGRHHEGAQRATHAGPAQRVANLHEGALAHHARGKAGALLIFSPGLLLGDEAHGLAATPDHELRQKQQHEANAHAKHGTWRMPATLLRLR